MQLDLLSQNGGTITCNIEHQGASGVIVLDVFEDDGMLCFGITQLVATIDYPPRRWLRLVRSAVDELSAWASSAGCKEIRMCGRDWSRIFPDFEPMSGLRNGLRKAL